MHKFIGGLLVVSLLSRPAVFNVHDLSYQILKVQNQFVCVFKRDEEEEIIESIDIDDALLQIENNKRIITSLIKEKDKFISKIQSIMDLFSHSKVILKQEQIKTFSDFSYNCNLENRELHKTLLKLEDSTELDEIKKEFFKKDSNLKIIYSKLKIIINYQVEAIKILEKIIFLAKNTVSVF